MMLAVLVALVTTATPAVPADASASARCRAFGADFSPSHGDPQRLRVRFTVSRFGTDRPIYLHYVGPNRHLRRTVHLGRTSGRCGFLRTGYRRLFPFRTRPGTWRLQFTARRAYRVRPARPYVTLAVTILRS